MSVEEHTVRDLIQRLAAEEERTLASSPTTAELRAYLTGELGEPEREKLCEHLSKDRQAARALLKLEGDRYVEAEAVLTSEQRLADREAVRTRLAIDTANQAAETVETAAIAALLARLRRARLIALGIGAVCLGLLGWHLGSSAVGRQPPAVEVVADLFLRPVEGVVRGDDGLDQLVISKSQRHVYLSLTAITMPVPERVRLVIHSEGDPQRAIEHPGLPTYGRFPLRLKLEGKRLPRGRVRLALYGEPDAGLIAEYLLEVTDD